jgi:hypothetical protein
LVNKSDQYALKIAVSNMELEVAQELIEKWGCDATRLDLVEKYKVWEDGKGDVEKEYC